MKERNFKKYLPYMILLLSAFALFVRAKYSFCWSDETFYASTTNRFVQGDAIFVHEWFPTQLVSLLLLPFQSVFHAITGSNDGIILFFRNLYVIFSFLFAVTIYRLIHKEYSAFTSLCCGLFYLFYAHLNIATMSYYTLSVSFFLMAMLLLCDYFRSDYSIMIGRRQLILCGLSFAAAVLSLPSLAIAYFVIIALTILLSIRIKWLRPVFPWTLLGILLLAVPVLIYVLPTSGLFGLIDNLPYVLSDEEHITSLVYPFKKFFLSVLDVYGKSVYLVVLLAILSFLFSRRMTPVMKSAVFYMDTALFLLFFVKSIGYTGYISTALILFALPLFFLSEKRNYHLFFLCYGGGLIFSMVFSYSSNGDLYIMTLGHSISAIAAICFLADYMTDVSLYIPRIVCITIIGIVTIQTMTLRLTNIYRDAPIPELTALIQEGPARGLYTTPEHLKSYQGIYETIREYSDAGKTVFFTKLLPWGYLCTDMRCGAPTTWRTKLSSSRLELYYTQNPDKIPDVVFVLPDTAGAYDTCGDVVADPVPNENEIGGWLYDYMMSHDYQKVSTDYADLYIRP